MRESAARATDVCGGTLGAQVATSMAETHTRPAPRIVHSLRGVGISPPGIAAEPCTRPRHVTAHRQTQHTFYALAQVSLSQNRSGARRVPILRGARREGSNQV